MDREEDERGCVSTSPEVKSIPSSCVHILKSAENQDNMEADGEITLQTWTNCKLMHL